MSDMTNVPQVSLGIVAVSRDCFPLELARRRGKTVIEACGARELAVAEMDTIVESERDIPKALEELERAGAKSGNMGWTAALSAIEMADLEKQKLA